MIENPSWHRIFWQNLKLTQEKKKKCEKVRWLVKV
jgi:hypothetical protein